MSFNTKTMNPVPIITTKSTPQHYPAFSLPTHTAESLQAAYKKQATINPRSVSVIATTSSRSSNSNHLYNFNSTTDYMGSSSDHPYQFLVPKQHNQQKQKQQQQQQQHHQHKHSSSEAISVKSLKTLCQTTSNLPTLLRASLEANLVRGMATTGTFIFIYIIYRFYASTVNMPKQ